MSAPSCLICGRHLMDGSCPAAMEHARPESIDTIRLEAAEMKRRAAERRRREAERAATQLLGGLRPREYATALGLFAVALGFLLLGVGMDWR